MIDYKSLIGQKNAVRNIPQEEFQQELSNMAEQLAEVDYHYTYSDEVLKNAWKKLKAYKNSDNFTASQTRPGLELCEHFFPNFFQIENNGVDEDGSYERFSQRVGDGAIPINDSRFLIPSEPEAPKAFAARQNTPSRRFPCMLRQCIEVI